MEKVRTEDLKPGMKLAKTIYSTDGRTLVREQTVISESLLSRLKEMGLPAAYIKITEENRGDEELISEATRVDLVRSWYKIDSDLRSGKELNINLSKQALFDLVDEIMSNRKRLVGLTDIRLHNDYTYGHSVHVCAIAVKIGLKLCYNQLKLTELALGALFHDIGMTKVPLEILTKKNELTALEIAQIRSHPEDGFHMLQKNRSISSVASHVAYEHHERFNGSGYPRGLSGTNIHEYARITAIADVYDSLTTEKVYRPAWSPEKALQYISSKAGTDFDPELVAIFEQQVYTGTSLTD